MKPSTNIKHVRILFGVLLCALMQPLQAASLGLNIVAPDITSSFMDSAYDAGTQKLTVTGAFGGFTLNDGVTTEDIDGPSMFSLSVNIDNNGVLLPAVDTLLDNKLSITGTVAGTYLSGTMITGDITDFGFVTTGSQTFEFLFTPTGGDLLPLYIAGGGVGGIKVHNVGYIDATANFSTGFSAFAFNAQADTGVVPVPAAIWLMGSGLLGLMGFARRRVQV